MSKVKDGGITTAYGAAVRGGYAGTYTEFCEDLAKLAEVLSDFLGFSVTVETLAEGTAATGSYADGVLSLGIPRGNTGNGIESIVLNADYTLAVTYTNGQTWTSSSIRGATGATPNFSIGTVQTLEPGQSATASITGTPENPLLNLGIPKGQAGASGAGDVTYDSTATYGSGTVGAELTGLSRQLSDKQDKTNYVTLSGTIITQTGVDNTVYLCGELAELTFTAPATGITVIRFTSGSTPTVITLNGITMPDDWTGVCEANKRYDIGVLNGDGLYCARTVT